MIDFLRHQPAAVRSEDMACIEGTVVYSAIATLGPIMILQRAPPVPSGMAQEAARYPSGPRVILKPRVIAIYG